MQTRWPGYTPEAKAYELRTRTRQYVLVSPWDGAEYSADPRDYWDALPADKLGDLVRLDHPYKTVTGRTVYGPRLIKSDATIRDLRRLGRWWEQPLVARR